MKLIQPLLFVFCVLGIVSLARPASADWDNKGWEKLGERRVNGKIDHDTIVVGGGKAGAFKSIMLKVEDNDIELLDLEVTFGNGDRWHPEVHHFFKEGDSTHRIDFPAGKIRALKDINLRYKNLGRRHEHATVEVWGLRVN